MQHRLIIYHHVLRQPHACLIYQQAQPKKTLIRPKKKLNF